MGSESPRLTLSTPDMKVVATAPSPGVRIPSFPVAGAGGCVRVSAGDGKSVDSIWDCPLPKPVGLGRGDVGAVFSVNTEQQNGPKR
jgi:hypothetical protein